MIVRLIPILLLGVSCSGAGFEEGQDVPHKDRLIQENKRANRLETLDIRNYVARHGLDPVFTGTGVAVHLVRDRSGERIGGFRG